MDMMRNRIHKKFYVQLFNTAERIHNVKHVEGVNVKID